MTPARPIPINGRGNGKQIAGSAFLVSGKDRIWLMTCVHNLSSMRQTPLSALDPSSTIHILGTSVLITNLFSRSGIVRLDGTPFLVDCMSIQLSSDEANALAPFGAFLLTDVIAPAVGNDVTFAGFPGITTQPISASSVQSRTSQVVGVSIALDSPALPGYSGGPLYTDSGLIGVMHGDLGTAPNFTNGLAIGLDVIRGFLFP